MILLGKSDSTEFELFEQVVHEGVLNTECQDIMGSNKKSKQCGINNLNLIFLGGQFIQDVFDDLIFHPLKLKGIIIQYFLSLQEKTSQLRKRKRRKKQRSII